MIPDHDEPIPLSASATPGESAVVGIDDAALLRRLKDGDEAAFAELVHLAGGRLLRLAKRMLGKDDDAEDAVQEAFISAFKALANFDGRSRLTTWLHRITVNACLMKLRGRPRRAEVSLDELLPSFQDDGHHQTAPKRWKPLDADPLESRELRDLVRARIDELPEAYRVVLLLRDIEGLDTAETAAALGTTVEAVKMRLHRARLALKALLEPHFADGVQ